MMDSELPAPEGAVSRLRDRLSAWRDRLLSNTAFQRWAASFPLTRPIARRRARALFDLCAGFVYSQVLLACVRLRLFEILADGPQTADVLAARLAMPADAARRLLAAAVSLRLLERRGNDRFGLGDLGAALAGNPGIAAMVEHHAMLYADLLDPVALLQGQGATTELSKYWAYAKDNRPAALPGERIDAYSTLMTASQPLIAGEVFAAYPLHRHRCLLDVGGGEGAFLMAAAAHAPHLRLMLFDLPPVAERARARIAAAGLAQRATTFGGDFWMDALPTGADLVSLIRVLHDHNDDAAIGLLRAARRALPENGTLLLAEPLAGTPGAETVGDAYFGFYLLAMGRGRARTPNELTGMLHAAGFDSVRLIPTNMPLQTSVVVARAGTASRE
jgi:demethylspheroidene O-methyltransferase